MTTSLHDRVKAMLSYDSPYISESGDEIGVAHGEEKGMVTLYINRWTSYLTIAEVEALKSALSYQKLTAGLH